MSGRRGRPPGARLPSEKDLQTLKKWQVFHQQPFAPIFQQRMEGGASQGAGSDQDHVDLTNGSGFQEKERIHACMLLGGLDDQDPNDWDDEACKTAGDLTIPVTYMCSSDNDVSHDDGEDLSATATEDLSATQEDDACHDSDDHEGEDSEDTESAAAGPSGEYSQKRGGPVPRGDGKSRRGGKRRKT
jgi:hypothetical protein